MTHALPTISGRVARASLPVLDRFPLLVEAGVSPEPRASAPVRGGSAAASSHRYRSSVQLLQQLRRRWKTERRTSSTAQRAACRTDGRLRKEDCLRLSQNVHKTKASTYQTVPGGLSLLTKHESRINRSLKESRVNFPTEYTLLGFEKHNSREKSFLLRRHLSRKSDNLWRGTCGVEQSPPQMLLPGAAVSLTSARGKNNTSSGACRSPCRQMRDERKADGSCAERGGKRYHEREQSETNGLSQSEKSLHKAFSRREYRPNKSEKRVERSTSFTGRDGREIGQYLQLLRLRRSRSLPSVSGSSSSTRPARQIRSNKDVSSESVYRSKSKEKQFKFNEHYPLGYERPMQEDTSKQKESYDGVLQNLQKVRRVKRKRLQALVQDQPPTRVRGVSGAMKTFEPKFKGGRKRKNLEDLQKLSQHVRGNIFSGTSPVESVVQCLKTESATDADSIVVSCDHTAEPTDYFPVSTAPTADTQRDANTEYTGKEHEYSSSHPLRKRHSTKTEKNSKRKSVQEVQSKSLEYVPPAFTEDIFSSAVEPLHSLDEPDAEVWYVGIRLVNIVRKGRTAAPSYPDVEVLPDSAPRERPIVPLKHLLGEIPRVPQLKSTRGQPSLAPGKRQRVLEHLYGCSAKPAPVPRAEDAGGVVPGGAALQAAAACHFERNPGLQQELARCESMRERRLAAPPAAGGLSSSPRSASPEDLDRLSVDPARYMCTAHC